MMEKIAKTELLYCIVSVAEAPTDRVKEVLKMAEKWRCGKFQRNYLVDALLFVY